MISLNKKQSGFTIVELLIVIVVIGILAALVITTFAGIQKKARDTERTTDIKAIHGQLEAYYAQEGTYPALAEWDTDAEATALFKGLDKEALRDPKGTTYVVSTTSNGTTYGYAATPAGCTTAAKDCTDYTLTATLEGGGTYTKEGLN